MIAGRKSLVGKMMRWFLIAIMLPMLILAILFCTFMTKYNLNVAINEDYAVLNTISESIVSNAEMVENGIKSLSFNDDVLKLLTARQSPYQKVIQQWEVLDSTNNILTLFTPLHSQITLYVINEKVPITYWKVLKLEDAEQTEDYQRFLEIGENEGWVGRSLMYPQKLIVLKDSNKELICYYHKVFSGAGEFVGVLKCGVAPEKLFSAVTVQSEQTPIYVQYNSEIIFGGTSDSVVVDISKPRQMLDGKIYLVKNIEQVNLALVMPLDYHVMLRRTMISVMPMLLGTLASGLFLLFVTQLYLHGIHRRLDHAVAFAEQVRGGQLDIRFPDSGEDEISKLIVSFNELLDQYQTMARQQIENERREKHALRLALQYQMNPHFLFNTLNWLQMSTEMHVDREHLSEGIVHLGRLLRYNLNENAYAPLSEEIRNTIEYIQLMNMRKNNLISMDVDVAKLDGDWPVMRFIFQPLCENAIQHGMRSERQLNIRIFGEKVTDGVRFTVENDGETIPEERLERLRKGIECEEGQNGIGLANIAARLRLLYGSGSNLKIQSDENRTCVTMLLQNRNAAEGRERM